MKIGLVAARNCRSSRICFFLSLAADPSAVHPGSHRKRVFHSRGSVAETGGVGPTASNDSKDKPLILQVGSHMLFAQAHIPGSEYAGPGSQPAGIEKLAESRERTFAQKAHCALLRLLSLNRCPNLGPAFAKLREWVLPM